MVEIVDVETYQEGMDENVPEEYREFRDAEGIPVHTGLYLEDINAVETGPWARTGQDGAFVNLYGAEGVDDLQVHDVEPGGETTFQNHLHEEIVLVTRGEGFTVFGEGEEEVVFEWDTNALFFIPPYTPYRHINASNTTTARLVSHTPLPQVMNLVRDPDIVFPDEALPFELKVTDEQYSGEGTITEKGGGLHWDANFVPDIMKFEKIRQWQDLGTLRFVGLLLESGMGADCGAHIGEIPARRYKSAHRHGPGANVFVLSGEGYSLMWREGMDERVRIDWEPGAVFAPPARWFHQHFNLTDDPARTFATHCPELGTLTDTEMFRFNNPENIIEHIDEHPLVRETYEEELAEVGLETDMPAACYTDPDFSFEA